MELAAVNSPGTAFVAGLVTSLHCAGMCGPLACTVLPGPGSREDPLTIGSVYQISRLAGYTLLGALAGGIGRGPLGLLTDSALRWLPWVMVLFFVGIALRLDRRLPKIAVLGRLTWTIQARMRHRSRVAAAASLGLATPLLPCGPLYFILALAMLAGSALHGAEVMLAFALGTLPLLWMAQSNFNWLRRRLSPLWLGRVRIALALATAAIISWRLRATLGFAGPDPLNFICS